VSGLQAGIVALADADERLVEAWRELASHAAEPNPFAEPEFVLPAARLLDDASDPSLLVVWRGPELCLALPVIRRSRMHHLPVPALTTWTHPYCYLGTPLLAADPAVAAWGAALDLLARTRNAPRLVLTVLPSEGPVRGALARALQERRQRAYPLDPTVRAVLRRRATASYLDDRVSAAHRRRLARSRARLAGLLGSDVSVVDRARSGTELDRGVEDFLRLEGSGWKGRAGTAMSCVPPHAEFFRAVCRGFHQAGRLSLLTLTDGQTDVAMACALFAGDTVFHLKVAYDEAYRQLSPGLQLELELISRFHQDDRFTWIDSCSDGADSLSARLYPDRRAQSALMVPLHGMRGATASRWAPTLLAAGRFVKHGIADRREGGAASGPPRSAVGNS
jgi:CelD/BcsL family acetyltransferase involved in cellulose biosynthesis